jgi:hypothetical protein
MVSLEHMISILWEIANVHRGSVTCLYIDANYIQSGEVDEAVRVWDILQLENFSHD